VTTEAEAPHASSDDSSSSPLNNIAQTLKSALPSAAAAAATVDKTESKDIQIGSLGILHPSVLEKFGIVNPCSALEIDVEAFL
jgi:phenylalanyl-tRNA synthetase beta chain